MSGARLYRRYVRLLSSERSREVAATVVRWGDIAWLDDRHGEMFQPGSIYMGSTRHGVVLNMHHDRARPLCRTGAGLDLEEDREKMYFVASLPETAEAEEALAQIRAGVIRGASAEFTIDDCSVQVDGERKIRVVQKARIYGIGLVDTPAYPQSELRRLWAGYDWNLAPYDTDTPPAETPPAPSLNLALL